MTPDKAMQVERLIELGRTSMARQLLGEAVREDPNDAQASVLAAKIELEEGNADAALASIERALARDPHSRMGRLVHFRALSEAKDFGLAEQVILGLLRENPANADFLAQYAWLMMQTLHVDKAAALCAEAIRLSPEQPLARTLMVLIELAHGKNDRAQEKLSSLVQADPEAYHVAWLMLSVLQARGRYAAALEVARALLRANPNDASVLNALIELRVLSHWSTVPLRPLVRYGWAASGLLWAGAALLFPLLVAWGTAVWIIDVYLGFIVYSWVYPPLLRRWLRWRGF